MMMKCAGVYINGYRLVEMAVYGADQRVKTHGDIFVATHPFSLTSSPTYLPLSLPLPPLSLCLSVFLNLFTGGLVSTCDCSDLSETRQHVHQVLIALPHLL